jgi:hypothetical protein
MKQGWMEAQVEDANAETAKWPEWRRVAAGLSGYGVAGMGELTEAQVQELKMWAEKDLMLDGAKGVLVRADDLLALVDTYSFYRDAMDQYEAQVEGLEITIDDLRAEVQDLQDDLAAVTEALDA